MSEQTEHPADAPVLSHWPIRTVDYEKIDENSGYGDAKFLDIGQSTWNKEDISAKVWRRTNKGKWSRQSEELPLSRVLDLAILVASVATGRLSTLNEHCQNKTQDEFLQNYLLENTEMLNPKLKELGEILADRIQAEKTEDGDVPNIFSFATSELSQDALFAWLLSWASPECAKTDASLHKVAVGFVRLVTGMQDLAVNSISVTRQWEHIDIVADINEDKFLVIEDKTFTTRHSGQLERYKASAKERCSTYNRDACFSYIKTGNEPRRILKEVLDLGYRPVLRKDVLACLNEYTGDNVILCNYRDHLKMIDEKTESFRKLHVKKWCGFAWEGFYKELEKEGLGIDWSYVDNASGGFLGAWWHWCSFPRGKMYLQFEEKKLCFKICPDCPSQERVSIRNKCYNALIAMARDKIKKPDRFGVGKYMTIGVIKEEKSVFGDGMIDVKMVIHKLREYEKLVDECCAHLEKTWQTG